MSTGENTPSSSSESVLRNLHLLFAPIAAPFLPAREAT